MGMPSPGYVNKTTTGLLVLPREHNLVREAILDEPYHWRASMSMCDQCFACTEVCPRYLIGHRLEAHTVMRDVSNGITLSRTKQFLAMSYLCCHCDLCRVWGCPVNLAPGKVMRYLKEKLTSAQIENPYRGQPQMVREFRTGRRPSVAHLIPRLGLTPYDVAAPLDEQLVSVERVRLSLRQHIGAPCASKVRIGEHVCLGDIIADVKETELGVPLHASIAGIVNEITDEFIEIRRA
jgi:Na+-translocating ferredoxin:NAD+ oxidoreductase RnfC subunit